MGRAQNGVLAYDSFLSVLGTKRGSNRQLSTDEALYCLRNSSGSIFYYLTEGGPLHRENGPAVIHSEGGEEWFSNGKRHREDGPAVTRSDGRKEWWVNDELHREGKPAIVAPGGREEWYVHNKKHRLDGPAFSYPSGYSEWWVNDKLHREDGPAVIYVDRIGQDEWYWQGQRILDPRSHPQLAKFVNGEN